MKMIYWSGSRFRSLGTVDRTSFTWTDSPVRSLGIFWTEPKVQFAVLKNLGWTRLNRTSYALAMTLGLAQWHFSILNMIYIFYCNRVNAHRGECWPKGRKAKPITDFLTTMTLGEVHFAYMRWTRVCGQTCRSSKGGILPMLFVLPETQVLNKPVGNPRFLETGLSQ